MSDPHADDAVVFEVLSKGDALAVVLRAAVFIESQLDGLIEAVTNSKEAVKRLRLDYAGKVDLCLVLGLDERFGPALGAIGTIRNRFAHTLAATITSGDADAIYKAMAPRDKEIVQSTYAKVRKASAVKRPAKMSSLDPLERFTLYAVTLRAVVIAGRKEVAGAQS